MTTSAPLNGMGTEPSLTMDVRAKTVRGDNGEGDSSNNQNRPINNINAAAHLQNGSKETHLSPLQLAMHPLHLQKKNGSHKAYENGNGRKRRRIEARSEKANSHAANPPRESSRGKAESQPTEELARKPRDADVDKHIAARRSFFHEQLHTTNANLPRQELAANGVARTATSESSSQGRALWLNDSSSAEKNLSMPTGVFQTLAELEDQSTNVKNPFRSKDKARDNFASITVHELEETIKTTHYGEKPRVESMVLQFNECSSLAIAKWVSKHQKSKSTEATPARVLHAAVNAQFRKCAICEKTGHYELECPVQHPQQTKRLLGLIKLKPEAGDTTAVAPRYEDPKFQNPLRQKTSANQEESVVLENCCGFVIEQRKDLNNESGAPNGENANDGDDNNPHVDKIEVDGFVIKAMSERPVARGTGPISVNEGDFVTWYSQDENNSLVFVGKALSSCQEHDDNDDDKFRDVSIQCIAAIPRDPTDERDENGDGGTVGEILTISREKLRSLKDSAEKLPTINFDEITRKGKGKRTEGTSKQRKSRS